MEKFERFSRLWTDLGMKGDARPVYEDVAESYSEAQRHYHVLDHPFYAIGELDRIGEDPSVLRDEDEIKAFLARISLPDPDDCLAAYVKDVLNEAAFSLIGHDKVYRISRHRLVKDNELRSAEWTRDTALAGGMSQRFANDVYDNVLATDHTRTPQRLAAKLTIDCDLAILARPQHIFDRYEEGIRKEWWFVPEETFRSVRAGVLEKFLQREHIYETQRFRTLYEAKARENLAMSIARLRQ